MQTEYRKEYSPIMGREMECKIYGHGGRPVLFIPCQDGRFFDFEGFRMTDVWAPWIDSGRVRVFAVDAPDQDSWSDKAGDPRQRIERYERWLHFIIEEMVPFMRDMTGCDGVMTFGCSLGATHAANLYLRWPDLFDGMLALSGIYTASYGFDGYMDDLVYQNSPEDYMANLPADHPYIELYNRQRAVICAGQGPWELPDSTRHMGEIFREKDIHIWVDLWGCDVAHDWDWWYKQVVYFLPYLLGENN